MIVCVNIMIWCDEFTARNVTDTASSLQVVERVAEQCPSIVISSFLPPEGSTFARYLIQRLRASFADLPIVVGRWGDANASENSLKRLMAAGASHVVTSLAGARDRILDVPKQKGQMGSPAKMTSQEGTAAHDHV